MALEQVSLRDVLSSLLTTKEKLNYRAAYIRSLRQYLSAFIRGREDEPINTIGVLAVEQWFNSRSEAPSTMASNMGRLACFFEHAKKRGWLDENPVRRLDKPRLEPKPPAILTPAQAKAALEFTWREQRRYLAYLALILFGGVRPLEARQLSYENIDFDTQVIRIDACASKVRSRRLVRAHGTCFEWLKVALAAGSWLPITLVSRRRYVRRLADALGMEGWCPDLARHTTATYWLALTQDAAAVAAALGNSVSVLARHYVELATKEQAAAFWSLTPTNVLAPGAETGQNSAHG